MKDSRQSISQVSASTPSPLSSHQAVGKLTSSPAWTNATLCRQARSTRLKGLWRLTTREYWVRTVITLMSNGSTPTIIKMILVTSPQHSKRIWSRNTLRSLSRLKNDLSWVQEQGLLRRLWHHSSTKFLKTPLNSGTTQLWVAFNSLSPWNHS